MLRARTIAAVGLLALSASAAVFAVQSGDWNRDEDGLGFGKDGNNGHVVGAPGPTAGVGLPVLAIAGGYVWIRRQRRKNPR
jgi:hypothetical protein